MSVLVVVTLIVFAVIVLDLCGFFDDVDPVEIAFGIAIVLVLIAPLYLNRMSDRVVDVVAQAAMRHTR